MLRTLLEVLSFAGSHYAGCSFVVSCDRLVKAPPFNQVDGHKHLLAGCCYQDTVASCCYYLLKQLVIGIRHLDAANLLC